MFALLQQDSASLVTSEGDKFEAPFHLIDPEQ